MKPGDEAATDDPDEPCVAPGNTSVTVSGTATPVGYEGSGGWAPPGPMGSVPPFRQGPIVTFAVTVTAVAPIAPNSGQQGQQACYTQRMMVTSYNDQGAGSDWAYWKNHPEGVGAGDGRGSEYDAEATPLRNALCGSEPQRNERIYRDGS